MAVIAQNEFLITATDLASQQYLKVDAVRKATVNNAINDNKRFASSNSNARQAVFSLSQAIQDAPYGFRGVANNIEFLTQNLVQLTASSGGVRGALSAIGATLSGPVGILFAVSAVTSAIQIFMPTLGQMGRVADETKKSMKDLSDGVELFIKNIRGATTAQLDFLFVTVSKDIADLEKQLDSFQKKTKVTVGRSGLIATEQVFSKEDVAQRTLINDALERNKKLLDQIDKLRPGDTERINEQNKELERQADLLKKQNKELEQQDLLLQRAINRLTNKFIPFEKEKPLPFVKQSNLPEIDPELLRNGTIDLIDQFKQLGATAQNVNSFIVSSTQGAAAAITDAFFGATKSIEEFFLNMVKNIVNLLVEQLLVNGILSILGGIIGGPIGVGAAVLGGGSGVGSNLGRSAIGGSTSENFSTITVKIQGDTIESRNRIIRAIKKAGDEERF